MTRRILVTGAAGQIGTELTMALRARYGPGNVIAAGYKRPLPDGIIQSGPIVSLDVRRIDAVNDVAVTYGISTIFHLAGILSAIAEEKPDLAWEVNVGGLRNILDVARKHCLAVFFPSSIGAFGPEAPPDNTPQDTIQRPRSIYGITKVTGELLCEYYFHRYGVDTRGLRFPGLISSETPPGGGTTDYAVDIFYAAVKDKKYTCFLRQGTYLDMMYMPDAVRASIELMEAAPDRLRHRNAFNITAMSFAPEELAAEIRKYIPGFKMEYQIDPVRQAIADSWPNSLDDSAAREEWGWRPDFDLASMTRLMLEKLTRL